MNAAARFARACCAVARTRCAMLAAVTRLPLPAIAACAALASFSAQAQALPGGVQMGMTVPQLQQAVPGLRPVAHPARLAGGLVGSWSGPAVELVGVSVSPTFFLAEGQLRRVEYLAAPGAFDALLAWGRAAWGAELASQSPEGAYATWSAGEVDAYLQQANASPHPVVRLVVKRRALKDDSEL